MGPLLRCSHLLCMCLNSTDNWFIFSPSLLKNKWPLSFGMRWTQAISLEIVCEWHLKRNSYTSGTATLWLGQWFWYSLQRLLHVLVRLGFAITKYRIRRQGQSADWFSSGLHTARWVDGKGVRGKRARRKEGGEGRWEGSGERKGDRRKEWRERARGEKRAHTNLLSRVLLRAYLLKASPPGMFSMWLNASVQEVWEGVWGHSTMYFILSS